VRESRAALACALVCLGLAMAACSGDRADCGRLDDPLDRDTCFHERIGDLDAAAADQVHDLALQIEDPVVRGAAVCGWIEAHVGAYPQAEGHKLCELLTGPQRTYCVRRLQAVHLRR